jgi:hypothetical protein
VVLVVVVPPVVVVTVSVFPTLQPDEISAATSEAEIVSVLLLRTIEPTLFSHIIVFFLLKICELRCLMSLFIVLKQSLEMDY